MLPKDFRFSENGVVDAVATEYAVALFGADFPGKLFPRVVGFNRRSVSNDHIEMHYNDLVSRGDRFLISFVVANDLSWESSSPTQEIPAEISFYGSGKVSGVSFKKRGHAVNDLSGLSRIEYAEDGSVASGAYAVPSGATYSITAEEATKMLATYRRTQIDRISDSTSTIVALNGKSDATISRSGSSRVSPYPPAAAAL